jgi:hypothetical protein
MTETTMSSFGYGPDHSSTYGYGLHHVQLAIPPGSEDECRRRCVMEPADVLNPRRVRGQIAWASSVNAAATRVVGGASRLSS